MSTAGAPEPPRLDPPRADDAAVFRQALSTVRARSGVPVAFGGPLRGGALVLEHVLGGHSSRLRGLRVLPGRGLGGQVVQTERMVSLDDYEAATTITHHYDQEVLSEGIRGIAGVPVLVDGAVRGVLYAGVRASGPVGGVTTAVLAEVARATTRELTVRDEVARRVRELAGTAIPETLPAAGLEQLHAELCGIAADLDDPLLRRRVQAAAGRLAALGSPEAVLSPPVTPLSPREIDVLAEVELGCTNAEAAERLSLLPETVKAYLRSASRKLGVHGRYQAVLAARRRGFLADR